MFFRQEIEGCIQGNLCRCTGYRPIHDVGTSDRVMQAQILRMKRAESLHNCKLWVAAGWLFGANPRKGDIFQPRLMPEMKLFAAETGVEVIAVRKPAFVDNSILEAMKDAVLQPDCTADLAATKDGNSVCALQNCDPF